MNSTARARRHRFGTSCIGASLGMVVAGLTVLDGRLGPRAFVAYWLVCFVVTALAMVAAMLDFHAVRKESRDERETLLTDTLLKIEQEKRSRGSPGPANPPEPT